MNSLRAITIISSVACLAALDAKAAYGLKWKPGDDAAVEGAYLTAENAFEMRMRQPDGKIRKFRRDFAQPNLLYGDWPWVGEDMGNGVFRIVTNPDFKGGRTGFVFQNGHLRRMVLGRKDYQFDATPYPAADATNSVASLWPEELTKDEAHRLFATWKSDDGRLRAGYANPNAAGCLFAEVAVVGLWLMLVAGTKRKWWLLALGGGVTAAAFVGVALTQSRSAFVAFGVSAALMALFRLRFKVTWRRVAVAVAALAMMAGAVAASGAGARFTSKLVNASGDSDRLRVNILKAAPAMMADAPEGWGVGMSGAAYANWYQSPTEFRVVRTLVNSHLTWLVELGWLGRFLYAGGVFAAMFLLLLAAKRGMSVLPASLSSTLLVAGCFNSVMEFPSLWVLPCASVLLLFVRRPSSAKAISARGAAACAICGFAIGGALLAALACFGLRGRMPPKLFADAGRVVVNGERAATWVVDDGVVLGRGFMGRELRMFYAAAPQNPPLGVAWNVKDVPQDAGHIVVAGKRCEDFMAAYAENPDFANGYKTVIFLSPPFAASSVPESLASRPGFRVVQGERATRLTPDAANPPATLTVVPGAELYIQGWMHLALAGERKETSAKQNGQGKDAGDGKKNNDRN